MGPFLGNSSNIPGSSQGATGAWKLRQIRRQWPSEKWTVRPWKSWKIILQPLSARVHVNLLEGIFCECREPWLAGKSPNYLCVYIYIYTYIYANGYWYKRTSSSCILVGKMIRIWTLSSYHWLVRGRISVIAISPNGNRDITWYHQQAKYMPPQEYI